MNREVVKTLAGELGMSSDKAGASLSKLTPQWTSMRIASNVTLALLCLFVSIVMLMLFIWAVNEWRRWRRWADIPYEEKVKRTGRKLPSYVGFGPEAEFIIVPTVAIWLISLGLLIFFIIQAVLYGVTPDVMFARDMLALLS